MAQSLEQMGNDVRTQGGQGTGTMSELVFNPATGEFETVAQGSATSGSNMIVTEMTKEGFARTLHPSQSKRCSHEPTIWNRDNHIKTNTPSF